MSVKPQVLLGKMVDMYLADWKVASLSIEVGLDSVLVEFLVQAGPDTPWPTSAKIAYTIN